MSPQGWEGEWRETFFQNPWGYLWALVQTYVKTPQMLMDHSGWELKAASYSVDTLPSYMYRLQEVIGLNLAVLGLIGPGRVLMFYDSRAWRYTHPEPAVISHSHHGAHLEL